MPAVPLGVPSELLQRRPDIASAERQVVAANAQIGIERSAFFPSLSLGGTLGSSQSRLGDLLSASGALWSLGVSVAQTVFDAGAIRARVEGAEAGLDAAIARYRQTVLAAFQAVEDQLATRALAGRAGRAAPPGVGCRRPDRAADPQPLSRRPGGLHRRRHRAGLGPRRRGAR